MYLGLIYYYSLWKIWPKKSWKKFNLTKWTHFANEELEQMHFLRNSDKVIYMSTSPLCYFSSLLENSLLYTSLWKICFLWVSARLCEYRRVFSLLDHSYSATYMFLFFPSSPPLLDQKMRSARCVAKFAIVLVLLRKRDSVRCDLLCSQQKE